MNENVDPFNDWDAAYVLGALSMDERREYERHFASCAACAAAIAELAGIPGILNKIDADTAVALTSTPSQEQLASFWPESNLLQNLAGLAREQQRQRRRKFTVGMSAAAAVLLIIGILTGTAIHSRTLRDNVPVSANALGTLVSMSQVQPHVISAELRVTGKPWGTRFDWSCKYGIDWSSGTAPKSYDLVITDASGRKFTIATWSSAGGVAIWFHHRHLRRSYPDLRRNPASGPPAGSRQRSPRRSGTDPHGE